MYFNLANRLRGRLNPLLRTYQSQAGVYGFRPRPPSVFKVSDAVLEARARNANLWRYVEAYRSHGHLRASVNPVEFRATNEEVAELQVERYGLSETDGVEKEGLVHFETHFESLKGLREMLEKAYCGNISAEFSFVSNEEEREWLAENYEKMFSLELTAEDKKEIIELLLKCQTFDQFLGTKFPTVKRYGGDGAESMMAFFRQLLISSTDEEIKNIILGMPHRGKLNLITTMLKTRPAKVFHKFKGRPEIPTDVKAMCDIATHFHTSEDLQVNGKTIRFSLIHNPSHLEAQNPVVMGKARAKQQTARDGAFGDDQEKLFGTSVLNVILHGDAAFPAQGINQECLMMAQTPHFDCGGTIHMVVNNQVGFTTPGDRGRSSRYSTDLAKSIEAPVFHVNGDDPEALTLVTQLAFNYQRKFRKDVFIDLNCFRKYGHNELDDPTFTNPALYRIIHNRKSVPDQYAIKLIHEGVISQEDRDRIVNSYTTNLNRELAEVDSYQPEAYYFKRQWEGFSQAPNEIHVWNTGLDYGLLSFIGKNSVYYPPGFTIHPHLEKMHVQARLRRLDEGKIDWATAEALAVGSLMYQGHHVRISGEDVGRGTFSQRHAMIVDQQTNEMFIPLNSMKGGLGGKLEIANSILSEEAVLGFEYGYATENPNNLVIWEAQFGDFYNGAQIIVDQFIASGETKWLICNGLVMLLPHGYDGAASEHSSCRIERFLQLTDSSETRPDGEDINMQVINPTTPAQYFHALRRQIIRNYRKPLIVVAPKTLLRLSDATSSYEDFAPGTSFQSVLGDFVVNPSNVQKVILCSGKHYYALNAERRTKNAENVAIIRVESFVPFPVHELQNELNKYTKAKTFIWSQEEPRNMGAWSFVKPRVENMCGRKIQYSGRVEAPTTAVGVGTWHQKEALEVVTQPFLM